MIETPWKNEINAPTLRNVLTQKPKLDVMPLTEDLIELSKYIQSKIVSLTADLADKPSIQVWLSLATVKFDPV